MKFIEIENALRKYLPKSGDALSKAMRYSVFSGGKRIRPVLTIESSKICRGNIKDALPAACAIELIHTYSLIHDDLPAMDDDDFRRGKPACHKVFGEANAILAGDALLTLAFNIIAANSRPVTGIKIIRELSSSVGADGMVGGQALDLEFQGRERERTVAKKIDLLKTAKLFAAAAKIGALTAGAGRKEMKALERFGLYIGLSFQAVDDFVDGDGRQTCGAVLSLSKDGDNADNIEVKKLAEKANRELVIFGPRAQKLKEIADFIINRRK